MHGGAVEISLYFYEMYFIDMVIQTDKMELVQDGCESADGR